MEPFRGQCQCGAVKLEAAPPSKFCAHCHCGMCRRAHGAPLVTWIGFLDTQLKIVEGDAVLVRYRSSEHATRSFCGKCGSMMLFQSTRWPGEVHVARALIPGDVDRLPQAHCFFSDKADWFTVADDLPRLGGPTGLEKL
jgi:hypothetical protein